jgi:hypothetical protein
MSVFSPCVVNPNSRNMCYKYGSESQDKVYFGWTLSFPNQQDLQIHQRSLTYRGKAIQLTIVCTARENTEGMNLIT